MKNRCLIFNSKIYSENEIVENGYIFIENGKIADIGSGKPKTIGSDVMIYDAHKKSAIPGFIDLQVNGAGGYMATDTDDKHFSIVSMTLAKNGTTSFLVATSPCLDEEHKKLLSFVSNMQEKECGARVLGVHMEGPFLNPKKSGANNPLYVTNPSVEKFAEFLEQKSLKIMTISPEIGDFDDIYHVAEKEGVVLSIGHSTANYDQAVYGFNHGCKMATHLFNTMNGISAREPGIVLAARDNNAIGTIICDGYHVHPSIIRMTYELFGAERLILITDSAPTSGSEKKEWLFEGTKIVVKEYTCFDENGTIMGSSLTMNKAAMFAKKYMNCSTEEIILMGAKNPALMLHMAESKGCLKVGMDADIVVINDEVSFDPYYVFVEGKPIFKSE